MKTSEQPLPPIVMNEEIREIANRNGFLRTHACCQGVDNKFCQGDHWQGNLQGVVRGIERSILSAIVKTQAGARALAIAVIMQREDMAQAESERKMNTQRLTGTQVLRDHEIALLVNQIRDEAVKYKDTQQLRARIAHLVVPAVRRNDVSHDDQNHIMLDVIRDMPDAIPEEWIMEAMRRVLKHNTNHDPAIKAALAEAKKADPKKPRGVHHGARTPKTKE
ncbi:hypothetical protein [Burkholderia phage BCSR5]|nr:hypothetical protein [Burkholderia phage BCSR5]